jgi:hypothetical protein
MTQLLRQPPRLVRLPNGKVARVNTLGQVIQVMDPTISQPGNWGTNFTGQRVQTGLFLQPQIPQAAQNYQLPPMAPAQAQPIALPPPPATSAGHQDTQFADLFSAQSAEAQQAAPSATKNLVAELLKALRRSNITAGPPAFVRPHIWSDPIDLSATVVVPAAAGQYQIAVQFVVPDGYWARIEQYGVTVQDAGYTYNGSILWAFQVQGAFVPQGLTGWGEQRGSMVFPRKTFILGEQQQIINMLVKRAVTVGAPQTVQMGFRGWTWRLRNNYEGTQAGVTAY